MPKVSVIVPIFKVEKYIEKCAISLFEQTLDDIEFIFVDDCTPDRSIEILNNVIERYKTILIEKKFKVKIEKMSKNSGLAAVRKFGIPLATGDYIINCDSDDWVDFTMYEKMYNHAIKYNSDLVICDYIITNGNKKYDRIFKKNINECNRDSIFKRLLVSSALNPVWSTLSKRELFDNIIFPIGDMSEDKTFMIQLVWNANNITYLPEALYNYYQSPGSILRKRDREACIKKFKQSTNNRHVILNFLKKENIVVSQKYIDAYVFSGKIGFIEPFLHDPECRKLWKETFPMTLLKIYTNPFIRFKSKLKYLYARVILLF